MWTGDKPNSFCGISHHPDISDKGTFKDGQTDIPSQSEGNLTLPQLFYDSGTFNGGQTDTRTRKPINKLDGQTGHRS
jgi:hypothetical protein